MKQPSHQSNLNHNWLFQEPNFVYFVYSLIKLISLLKTMIIITAINKANLYYLFEVR